MPFKKLTFFLFFLFYSFSGMTYEIEIIKHLINYSTAKIKTSEKLEKNIFLKLKNNNGDNKVLIKNVTSKNIYQLQTLERKSIKEFCAKTCLGEMSQMSIKEEFTYIYDIIEQKKKKPKTLFQKIKGLTGMGFLSSANETGSINESLVGIGGNLFIEGFLYKNEFSFFTFAVSAGLNIQSFELDSKKLTFDQGSSQFVTPTNALSILTFQAPYNFHLLFLNYFDLFFGFNLNANISPYSKEWTDEEEIPTDDQGNTQVLKREEDITGGLSLGYQYGLNIFYKEWFVQFKQQVFKIPLIYTRNMEDFINDTRFFRMYYGTPSTKNLYSVQTSVSFGISF